MATVTAYNNLGFGLDMSAFDNGTGYIYLTGSYVGTYILDIDTNYDTWYNFSPAGLFSYNVYWGFGGTGIIFEDLVYYSSNGVASIFYDNINLQGTYQDRFAPFLLVTNFLGGNDVLTGNRFDDILKAGAGNDTLYGNAGNDRLFGERGNDTLFGAAGSDTLDGGAGADTLFGGAGSDTMIGGAGSDSYLVDSVGDRVFETTSVLSGIDAGGIDLVVSSVSFRLDAYAGVRFVENLALSGSGNINGVGNALRNLITGNSGANSLSGLTGNDILNGQSGNDRLNGGQGNDTLIGGFGADIFIFSDPIGPGNVDRITDYNVAADTIHIENAIFRGLPAGPLAAAAFVANPTGLAADSSDRIIYESDTGRLYFDIDGTGSAARIHFATLNAGLNMTANEFLVI